MNLLGIWDQLVDCVCRPPRDVYRHKDLIGGEEGVFVIGKPPKVRKFYREDLFLYNNKGQKLCCSHYRPTIVPSNDGKLPCVIYCHCNSGSRRDAEEALWLLLPHNITVFCLDFAGSGLSEGSWVTLGAQEVEDVAAVVTHLRGDPSTSFIGLWGRSMGAVTALMYAERDPSVAGVVADSAFSRLTDLMNELVVEQKLPVPRPLMKVAMAMMRRSVAKRAGFSIDKLSPLDVVPQAFTPVLFGHGSEDTFIPVRHSQALHDAYAGDDKKLVTFQGDHNSLRPQWFYTAALIFFHNVLRCADLDAKGLGLPQDVVNPPISAVAAASAAEAMGEMAASHQAGVREPAWRTEEPLAAMSSPRLTRKSGGLSDDGSEASMATHPDGLGGSSYDILDGSGYEYELQLQQALEESLRQPQGPAGAEALGQDGDLVRGSSGAQGLDMDEEEMLARAIAASLAETQGAGVDLGAGQEEDAHVGPGWPSAAPPEQDIGPSSRRDAGGDGTVEQLPEERSEGQSQGQPSLEAPPEPVCNTSVVGSRAPPRGASAGGEVEADLLQQLRLEAARAALGGD